MFNVGRSMFVFYFLDSGLRLNDTKNMPEKWVQKNPVRLFTNGWMQGVRSYEE